MKVNLRIKPLNGSNEGPTTDGNTSLRLSRLFPLDSYSNVFLQNHKQLQVYQVVCKDLVSKFLEGYSVTMMAYGQTGSGKTHTMIGQLGSLTESNLAASSSSSSDQQLPTEWGLFPRVASDLIKHAKGTIYASAVEVYFDDVFDLCNGRAVLSMKTVGGSRALVPGTIPGGKDSKFSGSLMVHPSSCYCRHCYMAKKGEKAAERPSMTASATTSSSTSPSSSSFSIQGEIRVPLKSDQDIARMARLIEIERTSKSHELNSASSRSHCIISLQLQGAGHRHRFTLVDLAGSERIAKTKVSGLGQGQAVAINESLSALGRVIKALKGRSAHVPFRDSTLTKMLAHSLKGRSLMAAIICVSGDPTHEDETLCSLKFGKEMAFNTVPIEGVQHHESSTVHESNRVDISEASHQQKRSQLENLRAKLATLEPESFGSSATQASIRLFQENTELHRKLENRVKELKIKQKESPSLVSNAEIKAVILQRDDVRDVILRQKTIPGFYQGPSKEYIRTLMEIRDLEME